MFSVSPLKRYDIESKPHVYIYHYIYHYYIIRFPFHVVSSLLVLYPPQAFHPLIRGPGLLPAPFGS